MKENRKKDIPKKFREVDSSFIDRLTKGEKGNTSTKFYIFPKKLNFYSKDPKVIICNGDGVTSRFVINKAVSFPQNTFKFYDGSIVCPHKK